MRALWPEALLAALFLAGDLFFTGTAAAAAGASAGVIAYLASVFSGRRKTVLLLEGLVLSALTLIALVTSFPGGAFTLSEVALGTFLLVSGIRGKPALAAMAGSLARGMMSADEGSVLSTFAGGALLFHGAVSALLSVFGNGDAVISIVLIVPVVLVTGALSGRRLREIRKQSLPVLEGPDDRMVLTAGGVPLGEVRVKGEGTAAVVEVIDMEPGNLPFLENALARLGHRVVIVTTWPHDSLLLSMNGYTAAGSNWRKMLRC
ncbi:MAG: hypothetical protein R6V62_06775 [Candidatus Fermentibacteraceae bacterium]